MRVRLGYDIEISCAQPTEVFALLDPHPEWAPRLISSTGLSLFPNVAHHHYVDTWGNACLRLTAPVGSLRLANDSTYEIEDGPEVWDSSAELTPISQLPDETIQYLLPSRYCETDLMMGDAWALFGGIAPGWAQVRAIFDYVHNHLEFGYEHARATRTAREAWQERKGVCRDFAHLAITLCRCMNIPARYANGYLGDIGVPVNPAPMDFNAWCEVWVGGRWVILDARHNEPRIGRITVSRGRDASDVPLLHSFGPHQLLNFSVWTEELRGQA